MHTTGGDTTLIIARGAEAIAPIRRNGRAWEQGCPAASARNETVRATPHLGRAENDAVARTATG
ncbi:hypothetical protein GCM10011415_24210 [Salipiger pallidus]|uniref:Uncharacterized protein n=1 Tax=Salipiger pallidus TaxID=1775170 RepID=A0A8J2ZKT0_9RHOB|nr:hypothetical protein GCM10011415_24210 [Salipiger pallidus]